MIFPNNDPDLNQLANQMISGMSAPGSPFADLPHSATEIQTLQSSFISFDPQIATTQDSLGTLFTGKGGKRGDLQDALKENINAAEQVVGKKSDQLKIIGWAPQGDPTALQPPAQCANFRLNNIAGRVVVFDWDKPSYKDGGKPSGYKVFRRAAGSMDAWILEDAIMGVNSTEDEERDFPPGTWEVAVCAINASQVDNGFGKGTGPLSNSVVVTVG